MGIIIEQGLFILLLADDSKFGEISTIKFSDINKCVIITNEKPKDNTYDKKTDIKVVDI